MISDENIKEIKKSKLNKFMLDTIPFFIVIVSFFISIYFQFKLDNDTALFVDKIIDLSSIFFGVFIGCLYLFEKFKFSDAYKAFMKFCKKSIYLNILLIVFSFLLIVVNPLFSEDIICSFNFLNLLTFDFYYKSILFSMYFSVFTVSVYYLVRFLRIIFILL